MNVLLFHVCQDTRGRTTTPQGPPINIMPIGLLALADRLDRAGHRVQVVHTGVEQRLDEYFDIVGYVEEHDAELVGLALHWHHQLGPVREAVDRLHRELPSVSVVVGGMTASAFALDIIREWHGVDFVVRGEGEVPLVKLVEALESQSDLSDVPNLVFRRGKQPVCSHPWYVAEAADMDSLDFCRLDLLRHAAHNNSQFSRSHDGWGHEPVFYVGVGRGCTMDCVFCSGGRTGHRTLASRHKTVFRSPERVVDDIRKLLAFGIKTICFCFDPPPVSESYYLKLFDAIRFHRLVPGVVFECYRPPSGSFLQTLSSTFDRQRSRISFSPTVADEELRSRLLGARYSNQQLEIALEHCHNLGLPTTLYFAITPLETRQQLDASLAWQQTLARRFEARLINTPIEMEPHAPWSDRSEEYGLRGVATGLRDYEERQSRRANAYVSFRETVGYEFPDVDVRAIRVRSALCAPDAYLGRAMATCGQGLDDVQVVAAEGQLEHALDLLARRVGPSATLIASSTELDRTNWAMLENIAQRASPLVRLVPLSPGMARNVLWGAARAPTSAPTLLLASIRDTAAARRLGAAGPRLLRAFPQGVVLVEECRWANRPCPANRQSFISLGADGLGRLCPSCPSLSVDSRSALERIVKQRATEVEARRGCDQCSVRDTCARCLYTGRIDERAYCEIRARAAPHGLAVGTWRKVASETAWGVALGWDD